MNGQQMSGSDVMKGKETKDAEAAKASKPKKWSLRVGFTIAPAESTKYVGREGDKNESSTTIFTETVLPFLLAGIGMAAAGTFFEYAQAWKFFRSLPQAIVLVPSLLGLKGNIEMTLASRLSTQANTGAIQSRQQKLHAACSNLSIIEAQGIVVAFIAAAITVVFDTIRTHSWNTEDALLLCLTSVVTASLTSVALGLTMIGVVLFAMRTGLNPDNITAPIAASLGDLITLVIMVGIGTIAVNLRANVIFNSVILVLWVCSSVFFIWLASKDKSAIPVLKYGWIPIFCSLFIGSVAGMILHHEVRKFPAVAAFQPVINGVGGNLVAIQASRISTSLHKFGIPGELPQSTLSRYLSLIRAFFSKENDAVAARVLLAMTLPGHAVFVTFVFIAVDTLVPSAPLITAYMTVALLQVFILLYICQFLVRAMWLLHADPDNNAIPLLTGLGDFLGVVLLACSFAVLHSLSAYSFQAESVLSLATGSNNTSLAR